MTIIDARDILAFPGGDNSTDTVIGDIHFNLTTLDSWNYTLYSNGTLSNGSWCLLTFQPYTPTLVLQNGTFLNATWCWSPVDPIGQRGFIGIGFAVAYTLALGLSLLALNKLGKLTLPVTKRFFPIGRRWQWYWALFACATALVSLFTVIDVDRYYLPELPIILTSFFWYLMQLGTMALFWEAVRHWGSWTERQYVDPDPFIIPQNDRRARVELVAPLVFYFFLWLSFFLAVPRNWGNIEKQRFPEQIETVAMPSATDFRFKAAAFCLVACWLITGFSLWHSIKHYCPRNRGVINRITGFFKYIPIRFMILFPLVAIVPAFQVLVAFEFAYSPLNVDGLHAAIYAGGYAPTLLVIMVQIIWAFTTPNEDTELKRQRRARGQEIDRELGIVARPAWWRHRNKETTIAQITRNVQEVQGNPRRPVPEAEGLELDAIGPAPNYPGLYSDGRESVGVKPDWGPNPPPPPPYVERGRPTTSESATRPMTAGRGISTDTTGSTNQPPQQIRSMLDV